MCSSISILNSGGSRDQTLFTDGKIWEKTEGFEMGLERECDSGSDPRIEPTGFI
jgi:hypothetical protein